MDSWLFVTFTPDTFSPCPYLSRPLCPSLALHLLYPVSLYPFLSLSLCVPLALSLISSLSLTPFLSVSRRPPHIHPIANVFLYHTRTGTGLLPLPEEERHPCHFCRPVQDASSIGDVETFKNCSQGNIPPIPQNDIGQFVHSGTLERC